MKASKTRKLTRKQFAQILKLPVLGTFYEVSTDQVFHMFNDIGHQSILTGISHFKKSNLPCIWSFYLGLCYVAYADKDLGSTKPNLRYIPLSQDCIMVVMWIRPRISGRNLELQFHIPILLMACRVHIFGA